MNRKEKLILIILLIATSAFARDVTLQWDYADTCDEFRIYRSEGSAHWPNRVGTVDCPTTTFTDLDVPNGYLSWVVTAYEADKGESNASNEVELAYYYGITLLAKDANGRIEYRGENVSRTAETSDTTWVITRFYYDAQGFVYKMETRDNMSWDNRATGWN